MPKDGAGSARGRERYSRRNPQVARSQREILVDHLDPRRSRAFARLENVYRAAACPSRSPLLGRVAAGEHLHQCALAGAIVPTTQAPRRHQRGLTFSIGSNGAEVLADTARFDHWIVSVIAVLLLIDKRTWTMDDRRRGRRSIVYRLCVSLVRSANAYRKNRLLLAAAPPLLRAARNRRALADLGDRHIPPLS